MDQLLNGDLPMLGLLFGIGELLIKFAAQPSVMSTLPLTGIGSSKEVDQGTQLTSVQLSVIAIKNTSVVTRGQS
jgi:hypothetical protein